MSSIRQYYSFFSCVRLLGPNTCFDLIRSGHQTTFVLGDAQSNFDQRCGSTVLQYLTMCTRFFPAGDHRQLHRGGGTHL